MPQSLSLVIVHLVFSTKDRYPYLQGEVRFAVHNYLAALARDLGCPCYRVGGVADHVHLALRQARTITLADLVENLKTHSPKWLKTEGMELSRFAWQRGYGAFSVSPRALPALIRYIDLQEEHHRSHTFEGELRSLLSRYQVEADERYLLD